MEALHGIENKAVSLVHFLIESQNLSTIQRGLKKDDAFKVFAIEYIKKMVKNEMSAGVNNPKLCMSSFKICLNIIEELSILTIDNKHAKNMPILQSLLRTSSSSIGILSHLSC